MDLVPYNLNRWWWVLSSDARRERLRLWYLSMQSNHRISRVVCEPYPRIFFQGVSPKRLYRTVHRRPDCVLRLSFLYICIALYATYYVTGILTVLIFCYPSNSSRRRTDLLLLSITFLVFHTLYSFFMFLLFT